ncbi:Hpt domain-containing protein [Paracoccus pacificus]|uniref:Hpt domain-containing protein n=1 Tax=Paracoccus pacificus TaxID=1463598 RepID=A0ABW4R9C3_9RHOB
MIDWDRVAELRSDLGPEEFFPVIELFVDEVEAVALRLSRDDAARLERDLHILKGSAWNLGMRGFGDRCGEAEALAAQGAVDAIDLDALLQHYADSKAAFTRDIGRLMAGELPDHGWRDEG